MNCFIIPSIFLIASASHGVPPVIGDFSDSKLLLENQFVLKAVSGKREVMEPLDDKGIREGCGSVWKFVY